MEEEPDHGRRRLMRNGLPGIGAQAGRFVHGASGAEAKIVRRPKDRTDGWLGGEGEERMEGIGAQLNAKLHVAMSRLPAVIRDETHPPRWMEKADLH